MRRRDRVSIFNRTVNDLDPVQLVEQFDRKCCDCAIVAAPSSLFQLKSDPAHSIEAMGAAIALEPMTDASDFTVVAWRGRIADLFEIEPSASKETRNQVGQGQVNFQFSLMRSSAIAGPRLHHELVGKFVLHRGQASMIAPRVGRSGGDGPLRAQPGQFRSPRSNRRLPRGRLTTESTCLRFPRVRGPPATFRRARLSRAA
jgi:hypothetical protein